MRINRGSNIWLALAADLEGYILFHESVLGMQRSRTQKKSPFLSAQKRATKPIDSSVMLKRLCRKQVTIKGCTCLSKWGPWAHCSLLNDQIKALLKFLLSKRKTNSHYWRKWPTIVLATQSCVSTMDYLLVLCSSLALVLYSLRLGICHLRYKKHITLNKWMLTVSTKRRKVRNLFMCCYWLALSN